MKVFNYILLLLVSTYCTAQSDDKYLDSLINSPSTQSWIKEFQTNTQINPCTEDINKAKKLLQEKGMPIYEYCSSSLTESTFDKLLIEICKKYNIHAKSKNCIQLCDFDNTYPNGPCYSEYLLQDLKIRKGLYIVDSIHKKTILSYLDTKPNFPVYNSQLWSAQLNSDKISGFTFPKVFINNRWQEIKYTIRDTLILSKDIRIKKSYVTTSHGKKAQIPVFLNYHFNITRSGELKKINLERGINREYLKHIRLGEFTSRIEQLAFEYIHKKYKEWTPANYYNRNILSPVNVKLFLKN